MEAAPIVLMKNRRRAMIPIDKIKVINSRTRDEEQFAMNVQSIDAVGQMKDIRVNDKFLARTGFYELICGEGRLIAQQRLGKTEIRAEIVTCTRKQAYLESLVENLARSKTGTMEYARELYALREEGWSFAQIAKVACRSDAHVRGIVDLVGKGEDRLIKGVEQGLFSISFAMLVAATEHANIQHVLMDAFDRGIVGSQNFAKVRSIINARFNGHERKNNGSEAAKYTVATLTSDIKTATKAKDSYVREAQGKESRLFAILDGLLTLGTDDQLQQLIDEEGLGERPELTGAYNVGKGS